jgi:predicted amidohydrolase YtcJ
LKPGKLADITVLDQNLLKINPKDILKTTVNLTIVDGKVVFDSGAAR